MDHLNPGGFPETRNLQDTENPAGLLSRLREENEDLKKELRRVVETAAANERIWRQFTEIERILFRTRELGRMARELLQEIKARFQPDQAVLLVCHPEILERFFPDISSESEPVAEGAWILPIPREAADSLCGKSPKPSVPSPQEIQALLPFLPENAPAARSCVMVPLTIHEILFGFLILGSVDQDRYRPVDGTDLLEQLGLKIALCMDNCLTYERVKDYAVQDPVTGLLNFFQIRTLLERAFRKARRQGTPLSVLLISLRFLSNAQDHPELRNRVLKHAADLLTEILPRGETALGRYGGDEFLILLPDVTEREAGDAVPYLTHMLRKSPFVHANTAILIQACMGVGSLQDSMKQPEDLLDAASAGLFRAKSAM
ncbi:MAG: DUF484 family protein [Deltaproteobacteria bacterium]|nr:DUF484 family protein [Deltaproteobacteria bacterium]